jgi:hypothetical protein
LIRTWESVVTNDFVGLFYSILEYSRLELMK